MGYAWSRRYGPRRMVTNNEFRENLIFRDRNVRIELGRLFAKIWNWIF